VAEGTFHEVKGKVKEITGELSNNLKLKAEGTDEKDSRFILQYRKDSMKHLRLAVIFWLCLVLLPAACWAADDGYGYPIPGSYEATILGTPDNQTRAPRQDIDQATRPRRHPGH